MTFRTGRTTRTIDLARDQMLTLERRHGCIEILHGNAWLTEVGAPGDTFLAAGDRWMPSGRPVILGALAPASVRLAPATEPARFALQGLWTRLARALERHRLRWQLGPTQQSSCR